MSRSCFFPAWHMLSNQNNKDLILHRTVISIYSAVSQIYHNRYLISNRYQIFVPGIYHWSLSYVNGAFSILHISLCFKPLPVNCNVEQRLGPISFGFLPPLPWMYYVYYHARCILSVKQLIIVDITCTHYLMWFMAINMFSLSFIVIVIVSMVEH